MRKHICPDDILALFRDEATKPEGRRRAVEWAKSILPNVAPDDEILLPDPNTGKLMSMQRVAHDKH